LLFSSLRQFSLHVLPLIPKNKPENIVKNDIMSSNAETTRQVKYYELGDTRQAREHFKDLLTVIPDNPNQ
jgi:hypothetical protein